MGGGPLKALKKSLHGWGFELNLIRRIHNVSNYWASGEIKKDTLPTTPLKVAVLAPHPDDESIGCGGTIGRIKLARGNVDVIYMTKGEQGRSPTSPFISESLEEFTKRRILEAEAACKILGVDNVIFLSGSDGNLREQHRLPHELAEQIDSNAYDIIFCPWPYDSHSDHEATYKIFRKALNLCSIGVKSVWLYEVWSPLHANCVINVDATIDRKVNALREYRSQVEINDFPSKVVALAQYRSIHLPQARHAEAFLVIDGSNLPLLP